jgi:ferrochelatase
MLWTKEGSPIKVYGYKLQKGVQEILGDKYIVELAMRYQNPSIEEAIVRLQKSLVNRIVVLPLFPHYASASSGSVYEEVMRTLSKFETIPELRIINSFPLNAKMIEVFASNARKYNIFDYDHIIFSYHGVPQRHMTKSDRSGKHCMKVKDCCTLTCDANELCYSAQCHQTTYAIANTLGLSKEQYTISFQSRLGKDPWMQPYTDLIIEGLQKNGAKKLLVFSPAFVSDCLETTIEIGHEYKEVFLDKGGEKLDLVASLNDDALWYEAVAEMVK